MMALGTALGGLVAGGFGVYTAFVVDAISFLVSALFILRIHYQPEPSPDREQKGVCSAFCQYLDGLKYLRRNLDISVIACLKAAASLTAGGALMVVQVALAERIYVIGKDGGIGLGLMFAAVGAGTGLGPIVGRIFTGDDDGALRKAVAVGFFVLTAGTAIMALMPSLPLLLFGTFLRGVGGGMNWVFTTQLLMQLLPDDVRGRVFASEFALLMVAGAFSAGVAGVAIDISGFGLAGTMWSVAGLTLIPAFLWILYLAKRKSATV
jgi:MFS family permease